MNLTRFLRNSRSNRRGFSLVELLVVLGIIAIIAGVTFSAAGQIGRSGNLESTINTISASLNVARSIALRDGKETAVLFAAGVGDQPFQLRVVVKNPSVSPTQATYWGFTDFDDRAPDTLGVGIGVAGPDFVSAGGGWIEPAPRYNTSSDNRWGGDSATVTNKWMGVWFNTDGTLKTQSATDVTYMYFYDRENLTTDPEYLKWTTGAPAVGESFIDWVPFIAIYDKRDLGTNVLATWLSQSFNATDATARRPRLLSFNRYSGLLQKN